MHRLTISVTKQQATLFDQLIVRKGYRNRSEAFRSLLQQSLQKANAPQCTTNQCIACISYVYDKHQQPLIRRLAEYKQRAAGITISCTQTPVDYGVCMETIVLHGDAGAVVTFADAIAADMGVRNAILNLAPIEKTT